MRVYFVRHGQTEHNVRGIIQGHLDTTLNDWGRYEARLLAESLSEIHFDEAYTSPLARASETAAIIVERHPGLRLWAQQGLKERSLGSMEGRRRKRREAAPADAESSADLTKRVLDWLSELFLTHTPEEELGDCSVDSKDPSFAPPSNGRNVDRDHPRILVVSHGAWLGTLLDLLLYPPMGISVAKGANVKARFVNTSVMEVVFWRRDGRWTGKILSCGDARHLEGVADPRLGSADDLTSESQ